MTQSSEIRPGQFWRSKRHPSWRAEVTGAPGNRVWFRMIDSDRSLGDSFDSLGWFLANFELLHESRDAAHAEALGA